MLLFSSEWLYGVVNTCVLVIGGCGRSGPGLWSLLSGVICGACKSGMYGCIVVGVGSSGGCCICGDAVLIVRGKNVASVSSFSSLFCLSSSCAVVAV